MTSQYSPYVTVLIIAAVTASLVARYAWHRRGTPGGIYFVLLMAAVAVWAFTGAAEFAATTIPAKITWSKLSYLGIVSVSPLWLLFSLSYSQRTDWLTRRRVAALWIVPLFILGLAATNEWHRLIWPTITPVSEAPGAMLIYGHGLGVWAHAVYAYISYGAGRLPGDRGKRRPCLERRD